MKLPAPRRFLPRLAARRQVRVSLRSRGPAVAVLLAAPAAGLLWGSPALAQSQTTTPVWNGGSPDFNNWSDSRNWVNGQTPSGAGQTIISFAGSTRLTPNNDYGAYTQFNQILFSSGAGSFTLGGSAIKLAANGGIVAKVENNSTALQTVSFNSNGQSIIFNGSGELDPTAGDLTINNNVVVDGSGTQTINVYGNGHVLTLNGAFGNGSASAALAIQGTSTVTLNGGNTYSGGTSVNAAATLNLNNATALGTGAVNLNAANIVLNNTSGAAITLSNNNAFTFGNSPLIYGTSTGMTANSLNLGTGAFSYNGDRLITLNGAGALTIGTLTQTANGAATVTVNNGAGTAATTGLTLRGFQLTATGDATARTQVVTGTGAIAITGPITNGGSAGGILYNGSGSLTISGSNNTYTGGINANGDTVNANVGKLNVNSATALGVGGTLTLSRGLFDNTSGAALTTSTSNPVVLNGDIGFSTSGGTVANSLTVNGPTVTSNGGRTINLNGAGALAFTGALTNTGTGNPTFVFNNGTNTAATTSLSFGGIGLGPAASQTIFFNGSAAVNVTGAVTDGTGSNNGLTYIGSNVMALSGNNTLTGLTRVANAVSTLTLSGNNSAAPGGVTLQDGRLNVNSATALGTGTLTIQGGTIGNTSGAAITETTNNPISITGSFGYGNPIGTTANSLNLGTGAVASTGSPTITLNGAGALTFGGTLTNGNTGGQTIIVNNGTGTAATSALNLGGYALTGAADTAPQVNTINGNGNINITGPVTNGTFAGSGLIYNGTGTLGLAGANTYTGQTTLSSGTLNLTGSTSGSNISVTGGTFTESTAGVIAGTGTTFTITGGTTTLAGQNTYTGNTLVQTGTLNIASDSTLTGATLTSGPLGTGILGLNGSVVAATGGAHTIYNVVAPNNDNAGTVAGSQNLTFAGNFSLSALGNHYTTLTVNNTGLTTFSGGINISGQQLTLNGSGNILVNSPITNNANFVTYAGTGSLTMSGANTYSGPTNVTSGTLLVNGTNSGTGTVTATGVGTILGGSGSITGAVTVGNGTTATRLAPGASVTTTGVGNGTAILGTGALTLRANSIFAVDLNGSVAGSGYDQVAVTGLVTLTGSILSITSTYTPSGTNFVLINNDGTDAVIGNFATTMGLPDGYSVDYTYNSANGSLTGGNDVALVQAVPEPGTVAAGLLALGTLGFSQRRRVRRWLGARRGGVAGLAEAA